MERIGDELAAELRRFGPQGAMPTLVAAWPSTVGLEVARNAWPARIGRDGTLHVNTSSSAWAFEGFTQLTPTVLDRLRAALGSEAPRALRFAPGPVPEPIAEPAPAGCADVVAPSAQALAQGAKIASEIRDEELRERVARAAALSLEKAAADRRF